MGLPAKGSRKITVDGIQYRWMANESFRDLPAEKPPTDRSWIRINLTIQADSSARRRSKIKATTVTTAIAHYMPDQITTPDIVEKIIRFAKDQGWRPDGPDFVLEDYSTAIRPGETNESPGKK
jgi:hypothetical protein